MGEKRVKVGFLVAPLLCVLGLAASSLAAFPQGSGWGGGYAAGRRGRMPSVDDQLKQLTNKLQLTEDQQSKIRPILADQRKQASDILHDSSLPRQDRRSKIMDLRESTDKQVKSVLNEDQQKKFDEMRQKQQDRRKQRSTQP
ncbi:MAG TPA: hypothetical protein VGF08_08765 [Terriglobales bacterium]|jgi:hypothetical protein